MTAPTPASAGAAGFLRENMVPWWVTLVQGIATLLIGLLLLWRPGATAVTITYFIGIWWLFSGIMTLISFFWDREHWVLKLISAALGIFLGIYILGQPLLGTVTLGYALLLLLAIGSIILGGVDIIRAFQGAGWGTGIIGAIAVALGLWLLFNASDPGMLLSLAWAAGLLAVIGGIAEIIMSFRIKGIQDKLEAAV